MAQVVSSAGAGNTCRLWHDDNQSILGLCGPQCIRRCTQACPHQERSSHCPVRRTSCHRMMRAAGTVAAWAACPAAGMVAGTVTAWVECLAAEMVAGMVAAWAACLVAGMVAGMTAGQAVQSVVGIVGGTTAGKVVGLLIEAGAGAAAVHSHSRCHPPSHRCPRIHCRNRRRPFRTLGLPAEDRSTRGIHQTDRHFARLSFTC